MQTIYFHNPGQLDIRGATTMGLSAKDSDSAIGKFGTGLKYAIASVLRWGGAISIETGGKKYTFSTYAIDFRGKHHEQIIMTCEGHSTELGYTTHYGSHWEPWQIFRELYSNAKDEGGGVTNQPIPCYNDMTVITVHCQKVADCFGERDTIILPERGDLIGAEFDSLRMLRRPSSYLYYRGVRVHKTKCLFTWDMDDDVQLTEDRSITDTWAYCSAIARAVQLSNDFDFILKMLQASEAYFEGEVCYSRYNDTSATFVNAAMQLFKSKGKKHLPNGVWDILLKNAPELDEPAEVPLTKLQQQQLDRAVELVCRMGLPARDFPISVVNFHKNTLGMWKNGKVLLSPQVFDQGTKQVVSTLYEEVLHATTGLQDCTYEMQTYLFNRIISLHEELLGEAC